jgi:hypothetical protein
MAKTVSSMEIPNNPFEMKFYSEGDIALSGISVKGVYRKNDVLQNQIISITDTSTGSDMQPIIFCGDLFNYFLGKQLTLDKETKSINHSLEKECQDYLSTLNYLKGFPNSQVMLCSSSHDLVDRALKLSSSLLGNDEQVQQVKDNNMQMQFILQHRALQPIMNCSDKKIRRSVEILGLNPEYPPHVIRVLWALREQL